MKDITVFSDKASKKYLNIVPVGENYHGILEGRTVPDHSVFQANKEAMSEKLEEIMYILFIRKQNGIETKRTALQHCVFILRTHGSSNRPALISAPWRL